MKSISSKQRVSTYFIADLHLDPSQPYLVNLFYDFIDDIKDQAEALYILGDLFEFWIGDDIIDLPCGLPYLPILEKLRMLSDSGVELYFLQGNRDFLAQENFANTIGAELLPDQKNIDLYGKRALIMHGDTLCTDDVAYQGMRFIFRLNFVQKIYLFLSPENRIKKANKARDLSSKNKQKKEASIMDVNQSEVENVLTKTIKNRGGVLDKLNTGVSLLIHGHTHRPAIHDFKVDGRDMKRVVLGDWQDKACYLKVNDDEFEFIH